MSMSRNPDPADGATDRRRAVVVAGHTGDEALVRAHLDDPAPGVRASAVAALARMGTLDDATLARALQDPDPEVRRRSLEVAAAPGTDLDVDLVPLLDDPDDRVVEVAAWALGEVRPPQVDAVPRLRRLARDHSDSLCREAAVASLGAIGDPAALPTILDATTDIATVRRRAVIALAPFDGSDVDEALQRATTDRDWQVRQAAEDLLAD
ncbi:MAG: HEAT repeat domain-containing protein [Acidimicrobiales bacterium]